jgi:hypothetical protein
VQQWVNKKTLNNMKMHGMCVEKTQIFFIYIYAWPLRKIIYRLTDREIARPNVFYGYQQMAEDI